MKIFKKLTLFTLLIIFFAFPVAAEDNNVYKEQYESIGADDIKYSLPEETRQFFYENNIDPADYNWTENLSSENVFGHILEFLRSGVKTPVKACAAILTVILLTAAVASFTGENGTVTAAVYASVLSVCTVIIPPSLKVITASVSALKGSTVFMLSFIPVFATVTAISGAVGTGTVMSSVLLLVTQAVSYISSFVITPLMGGYLAISISSSVSPLISQSGIAESIKKIALWILSLVSTVFLGVLGLQTTVSASADSLSMRTAKFILGSSVPVAGAAISEAFSTVTASIQLLRSSVGIYGVVALVAIFAPLLLELILWRICLLINIAASDIFSLSKVSSLLRAVDMMLSLLIGIILCVTVVFIISLTIVISAGKT